MHEALEVSRHSAKLAEQQEQLPDLQVAAQRYVTEAESLRSVPSTAVASAVARECQREPRRQRRRWRR